MTASDPKSPGDLLTESPREPAEGLTTPRTSAGEILITRLTAPNVSVAVPRSVLEALRLGCQLNDPEQP